MLIIVVTPQVKKVQLTIIILTIAALTIVKVFEVPKASGCTGALPIKENTGIYCLLQVIKVTTLKTIIVPHITPFFWV
jgi:hypothetical protein